MRGCDTELLSIDGGLLQHGLRLEGAESSWRVQKRLGTLLFEEGAKNPVKMPLQCFDGA